MKKSLASIIGLLAVEEIHGSEDTQITGLEYDSRKVQPGNLFFAFPGLHADGHDFIEAAAAKGAVAIVHDRPLNTYRKDLVYIRVKDARLSMSPIAAEFYDNPSKCLYIIGVTGTEGKSTTVYLIYQLLTLLGHKTGFFSTVKFDTGSGEKENPEHQTTPEALTVQRMLMEMNRTGCKFAVVESSSHGLSPRTGRLAQVEFDCAVLTNITHEHLEFHGTWETYRDDKARLFQSLDSGKHRKILGGLKQTVKSFGVVNADDPSAAYVAARTSKQVLRFSSRGDAADFSATDILSDALGSTCRIHGPDGSATARINLPGSFNVGNVLATLAAVSTSLNLPWQSLIPFIPLLKPVHGRMTTIDRGQAFEVIIDYAHTPSSFEAVLPSLRARIQGNIICVFGSGGERDREKRPLQGAVAEKYCDFIILADEDPRGEEPLAILEEIASGCRTSGENKPIYLIPDRKKAIRKAFSLASHGDLVILLGKGHENSIIYADRVMPYDEMTEALDALSEMGYSESPSIPGT